MPGRQNLAGKEKMSANDKLKKQLARYYRESRTRDIGFISFRNSARALQTQLAEHLVMADAGLTVYTKNAGIDLSKGCRACKDGRWLCIVVGHRCNASCAFCPQAATVEMEEPEGAFATQWMHEVETYAELFQQDHISGISYTGGEPLLYLDKVLDVAAKITAKCPGIYQWIYTNGLLAGESTFARLRDAGISEIRFNLAASDFADGIMEKVRGAKAYFRRVTVEVPSTADTHRQLVQNGKAALLARYGVTQLNLGELIMITPKAWETYGRGQIYTYSSSFLGPLTVPVFSRNITYAVMRHVVDSGIDLLVNDCSHDAKHLQIVRKNLNPFLRHFKATGSGRPVWQI
jgi:pyruvate formate-lyase activating enzyme-like uncharacterized protein